MRVLMLGWEYPPHISGGLGIACHGLAQALARNGTSVLFVVPHAHGDELSGPVQVVGCDDGCDDGGESTGAELSAGVEAWRVPSELSPYRRPDAATAGAAATPGRLTGRYGSGLFDEVHRYADAVAGIASRRRFDVVHGHDWMTYLAALAAGRARGRPVVLHVHSTEMDRSGNARDARIERIERQALRAADAVVCVSHRSAAMVAAEYGVAKRRIRVVHNALDAASLRHARRPRPRLARSLRDPMVLFLGRVTWQKGPDWLLEAAAHVVREEPRAKFVVAGTGDMLPHVIERTAAMGLARSVHFTGFLHPRDVERAFAAADVFVLPSISEPFGLAALEAAARGVPVIVSRQCGVGEVLPSALRTDYWAAPDLAAKILDVLRNPWLRRVLSTAGRSQVRALTWGRQARRVRALYEGLAR